MELKTLEKYFFWNFVPLCIIFCFIYAFWYGLLAWALSGLLYYIYLKNDKKFICR